MRFMSVPFLSLFVFKADRDSMNDNYDVACPGKILEWEDEWSLLVFTSTKLLKLEINNFLRVRFVRWVTVVWSEESRESPARQDAESHTLLAPVFSCGGTTLCSSVVLRLSSNFDQLQIKRCTSTYNLNYFRNALQDVTLGFVCCADEANRSRRCNLQFPNSRK